MNISAGFRKTGRRQLCRDTFPSEHRGSRTEGWSPGLTTRYRAPGKTRGRSPLNMLCFYLQYSGNQGCSKDETRASFTYGKEDEINLKLMAANAQGMAMDGARCKRAPASPPVSESPMSPTPSPLKTSAFGRRRCCLKQPADQAGTHYKKATVP